MSWGVHPGGVGVRRRLDGYDVARRYDGLGPRLATAALARGPVPPPDLDDTDPLAARVNTLIGLTGDAVGRRRKPAVTLDTIVRPVDSNE